MEETDEGEATWLDLLVTFIGVNGVAWFVGATLVQEAFEDDASGDDEGEHSSRTG